MTADLSDSTIRQLAGSPAVNLAEERGAAVTRWPVQFGLPLPRGQCFNAHNLLLIDADGTAHEGQWQAVAFWPDSSVKWVQVHMLVDLAAGETRALILASRRVNPAPGAQRESCVSTDDSGITVHADHHRFFIDTHQLRGVDVFGRSNARLATGSVPLSDANNRPLMPIITGCSHRTRAIANQPTAVDVELRGHCAALNDGATLHFTLNLQITLATSRISGSLVLHNPAAATHPGGVWDLGDPASIMLGQVGLCLNTGVAHGGARLRCTPDAPWLETDARMALTQWSSGGEHWQSRVHKNHEGEVPLSEPGYTLSGVPQGQQRGQRAQPALQLRLGEGETVVSATIHDFWQRFPTGLAVAPEGLSLALLPADTPGGVELQPGEQLTRRFALLFTEGASPADPFPEVTITRNPDYIAGCGLTEVGNPAHIDHRLLQLAAVALDPEKGFVGKRELIDEYGWRHFGELYADHENDVDPSRQIVSHFNNQYDPLFGCLRQLLVTGEPAWQPLAAQLAQHICDIDIYHTERDRPEYNHGLFWHTDHYLDAETATHRSYSRHHPSDAYDGHAGGGGPGGQHCYTTGLLYSYLLSGDDRYRADLYRLRDWITRVYEGGGTLVDVLLAVKQRHRHDLKNHLTGRYPLDRGTGNYLQALLDTHYLDRSRATLQQVAGIIRQTVHPAEDLGARRLQDVEDTWYYTVFLQAVCRYLSVKAELDEYDDDFFYARDCLLLFAEWMREHEAPYLDRPEILEFPNHTWTAQDLRKATILYSAASYTTGDPAPLEQKARAFVDHVATTLGNEPTRHYTRILALVMQNLYPSAALPPDASARARAVATYPPPTEPGCLAQTARLAGMAFRALRGLRVKRELHALTTRFAPFGVRSGTRSRT